MMAWRIVSPAPRVAGLALAGGRARERRGVLAQIRKVDSVAIYRGDEPIAVAMFDRHGWKRVEMALAVAPDAARHMGRLVRMAQLTLFAMAETHLIVVSVHPANEAGQRMAALVGFRRARTKSPFLWVYRRDEHGQPVGRWSAESSGREPQGPADRQ